MKIEVEKEFITLDDLVRFHIITSNGPEFTAYKNPYHYIQFINQDSINPRIYFPVDNKRAIVTFLLFVLVNEN
jgi:hypothetical protein